MHVFQPLEHFTLSLEHCQHFLCDPLVPRHTALSSLFSGLEDPRDPLASTLPLVERPRGEDGLCGFTHGEDLDGGRGEEDGLAEERLRWEMCGSLATGLSARDVQAAETHSNARMLWTIFWASDFFPCFMRQFVRRSSVGSRGGGRQSGRYPLAGRCAGGAGAGGGVNAEGDVRSRMAVNPEGGGGGAGAGGAGASCSRLADVASRLIAARGARTDIGGQGEYRRSFVKDAEKRNLQISHYVTRKVETVARNISAQR